MKIAKVMLVILSLAAIIAVLPGCKAGAANQTTISSQNVAVTRGNLTSAISAAGNLALSHTEDVAVDLFYPTGTKGTIGEVLVEEGETVTNGQIIATIDKNEWNDQLAALDDLVTAKERALVQAQINLKNAEKAVDAAKDLVDTRKTAVLPAEIAVIQAQNAVNSAITNVDFVPIATTLQRAKAWYDYVTIIMPQQGMAAKATDYELILQKAKEQLDTAQAAYDNALTGYTSAELDLKKKQLQVAQNNLEAAKQAITDAQEDIPFKELSLTLSQGSLEDAQSALETAKNNVTEAKSKSPEITAPFDGFITKVSVAGGDEVLNGTVVAQIADPDKFEADILVSEMDIPKVKVGTQATVIADSLPNVILTATVTHIAPTATISAGVVNYNVKVEVQPYSANQTRSFGSGQFPSGNVTFPSGNGTFPKMTSLPGGSSSNGAKSFSGNFSGLSGNLPFGQSAATASADVVLREGLTVTVTIIAQSKTDVLMVPNGAVTTMGGQSYVEVVNASGELEKRTVTTGISNWQYTEITDGLQEGEQVKVTLNTAPSNSGMRGGTFFMGG